MIAATALDERERLARDLCTVLSINWDKSEYLFWNDPPPVLIARKRMFEFANHLLDLGWRRLSDERLTSIELDEKRHEEGANDHRSKES